MFLDTLHITHHCLYLLWLQISRKLLNQGFLLVKLKSSLQKFYGHHHDLVDHYGISVSQMTIDLFHLSWTLSGPFLIHDLSPGFLHNTMGSPLVFSVVRVTRSLVLCVCFVDRCLSFCPWSFGHCMFFLDLQILVTLLVSSDSSLYFYRIQKIPRLLVASQDGYLYIFNLDPTDSNECVLVRQHRYV